MPFYEEEGEIVTILPETEATDLDEGFTIPNVPALVVGANYFVSFNGEIYNCTALDGGDDSVRLGNFTSFGLEGNGEPFALALYGTLLTGTALDGSEVVTLAIYENTATIHPIEGKFLPEGTPWIGDRFTYALEKSAAITYSDPNFGDIWIIQGKSVTLYPGESYTINYNGTDYTSICRLAPEGLIDDPFAMALGNFAVIGGENTGEPFALLVSKAY